MGELVRGLLPSEIERGGGTIRMGGGDEEGEGDEGEITDDSASEG